MSYRPEVWSAGPLPVEEAERRLQIIAKLDAAQEALETAYERWPELTAAQKDTAIRMSIRAVAALIRFVLYRLGSAGP